MSQLGPRSLDVHSAGVAQALKITPSDACHEDPRTKKPPTLEEEFYAAEDRVASFNTHRHVFHGGLTIANQAIDSNVEYYELRSGANVPKL